jgi:hypothetical protein
MYVEPISINLSIKKFLMLYFYENWNVLSVEQQVKSLNVLSNVISVEISFNLDVCWPAMFQCNLHNWFNCSNNASEMSERVLLDTTVDCNCSTQPSKQKLLIYVEISCNRDVYWPALWQSSYTNPPPVVHGFWHLISSYVSRIHWNMLSSNSKNWLFGGFWLPLGSEQELRAAPLPDLPKTFNL